MRPRDEILEDAGLTPQKIARDLVAQVLGSRVPIARPLPADDLAVETNAKNPPA